MLRVVVSGVESVGKSTMVPKLATYFGGLWIPEFGRTYTEKLRRDLELEDHYAIAEGHEISSDQAASADPIVLIEDTDIVMTTAWATMLFGVRDMVLAERESRADLHLLLLPDVPFVKDPVRMFGDEASRLRFHDVIVAEFRARSINCTEISGSWAKRRRVAIAAIEALL